MAGMSALPELSVPPRAPRATDDHVAIAWHGLPFYAARCLEELVSREPGVRFSFLTTASDDFQKHRRFGEIAGVPVRTLERRADYTWYELGLTPPELFIFTSWSHPAYLSLAADGKRRAGTRTVSMMDNIFLGRLKQWAGLLWFRAVLRRHIDAVWVPGARARAFARMLGVRERDITDRLYGADPCLFAPLESGEAVDARHRTGALFVGQMIERKGVPALLEAARRSAPFGAHLTMVGDGPLAAEVARTGVRVHGFLPPGQLAPLYAQNLLFILPSRADHWGVVLHEAALGGCLLAATRTCGAVDDLIAHGWNGYIMDEGSPEEILAAAAWAGGLTREEARAGRRLSMERAAMFGPDAFCRAFAQVRAAAVRTGVGA